MPPTWFRYMWSRNLIAFLFNWQDLRSSWLPSLGNVPRTLKDPSRLTRKATLARNRTGFNVFNLVRIWPGNGSSNFLAATLVEVRDLGMDHIHIWKRLKICLNQPLNGDYELSSLRSVHREVIGAQTIEIFCYTFKRILFFPALHCKSQLNETPSRWKFKNECWNWLRWWLNRHSGSRRNLHGRIKAECEELKPHSSAWLCETASTFFPWQHLNVAELLKHYVDIKDDHHVA